MYTRAHRPKSKAGKEIIISFCANLFLTVATSSSIHFIHVRPCLVFALIQFEQNTAAAAWLQEHGDIIEIGLAAPKSGIVHSKRIQREMIFVFQDHT